MRLEYEGLTRCEAVSTEGARWYNNPTGKSYCVAMYNISQVVQDGLIILHYFF